MLQQYNENSDDRKPSSDYRPFDVIAAIDIRGGRVVRLLRGDFAAETAYGDDPVAVAEALVEAGARWLHVVDLDGAREGRRRQAEVVRAIGRRVGERVRWQVAGGLRNSAVVAEALRDGAARAVLGTAALLDPAFAGRLVAEHGPDRIVVALDTRAGRAVGNGWVADASERPVEEALQVLAGLGVERFAVTAIERDGTLAGPDLDLLGRCVALGRGTIVASGGIASLADLRAVQALGCTGAIVGTAIYEGRFTVGEALAAVAAAPPG